MKNSNNTDEILNQLESHPPKIIGGYKKPGWAIKTLDKISNEDIETEEDGNITAKAILLAADETYYPSFLTLDIQNGGQIIGVYLISENEETYNLIPFEYARGFINKEDSDLTPFKYRTLTQIEGDVVQKNWPDFS
ncbi:hypothetical protein ACSU64_18465 [Bacillaceae bacterium C204]|uniref:hypothetical protein n=1 Tax=Neobacillus sp. 204 TaxID=3383351 RepID=UPI00397A4F7D